ncbi:MAG: hypothetical protein Tsb002_20920 [Wenzhouxiangellaceae bacterium]
MAIEQAILLAMGLVLGDGAIVVNSASDGPVDLTDNVITLRDAIAAANNDVAVSPGGVVGSGFDQVAFDPSLAGETITLTEGMLVVNQSLSIHGPGADQLTISGGGKFRLFALGGGGANDYEFFDLTLADAFSSSGVPGEPFSGRGSVIRMADSSDSVLLSGTVLRDNTTTNHAGGAVFVAFGDLAIHNSSIINTGSGQGTVHVQDGNLDISNSTLSGNTGQNGTIWARNSTTLTLNNTTIINNDSNGVFFSAEAPDALASVSYSNTIVANNTRTEFEAGLVQGTVTLISLGNNIIGDSTGATTPAATDLLNTDPLLAPLTKIDGQFVHPPLFGSPAIDGGSDTTAEPLDQLSQPRTDGNADGTVAPDIGAVESIAFVFVDSFEQQ